MAVTYIVRMHAIEGHEDEVEAVLLENVERIRRGEPGNLAFAVHRSSDDPGEFWLYETWAHAAVARHESGDEFKSYKERIVPLAHSPLFARCVPVDAVGYELTAPAAAQDTEPHRTRLHRVLRARVAVSDMRSRSSSRLRLQLLPAFALEGG